MKCSAHPARLPALTMEVKLGAKKDGTIVAAQHVLKYQAGAFPGSPIPAGLHVRLRDVRSAEHRGYRLRRGEQPAEGRGLSRAGCANCVICRGERVGRPGAQAWDGSDRRSAKRTVRRAVRRPTTGRRTRTSASLATLEAAKKQRALEVAVEAGAGAWHRPPASGSTSAASYPRRCMLPRTARWSRCRAARTSAARVPRSA